MNGFKDVEGTRSIGSPAPPISDKRSHLAL